jgi:hypothetical protein
MTRHATDGRAGDADYGSPGLGYSAFRGPEPRIAVIVQGSLVLIRALPA